MFLYSISTKDIQEIKLIAHSKKLILTYSYTEDSEAQKNTQQSVNIFCQLAIYLTLWIIDFSKWAQLYFKKICYCRIVGLSDWEDRFKFQICLSLVSCNG